MIKRSWVRISSHPTLDRNGVKAMAGRLKHPILVHSIIEKKENTGWQIGHTKKRKNVVKILKLYTCQAE